MVYEIIFHHKAQKTFNKLDKSIKFKISKSVNKLKQNPFLGKPLVGNLSGLWRLRIEKYRIIYQIKKDELIIFVLDIGHRKNIY